MLPTHPPIFVLQTFFMFWSSFSCLNHISYFLVPKNQIPTDLANLTILSGSVDLGNILIYFGLQITLVYPQFVPLLRQLVIWSLCCCLW